MTQRLNIVVTVGMGPWPFDRLLRGIAPLCAGHDLFVQRGTSTVPLDCPAPAFVGFGELRDRLIRADLVITHAGNSVRLVQRMGKLPIAVAREARHGEMANDHQVAYLRHEEQLGRVAAVWDVDGLAALVASGADWRLPEPLPNADPDGGAARMVAAWAALADNPFDWKREAFAAYIWEELRDRAGKHQLSGLDPAMVTRMGAALPGLTAVSDGPVDSLSMDLSGHPIDESALARIGETIGTGGLLLLQLKRGVVDTMVRRLADYGFPPVRRERAGALCFLTARKTSASV